MAGGVEIIRGDVRLPDNLSLAQIDMGWFYAATSVFSQNARLFSAPYARIPDLGAPHASDAQIFRSAGGQRRGCFR